MSEPNEPRDEGAALLEAYNAALQRGETEAMGAAAMRVLAFACERAEKEPSADLLLKMEAREHEEAGDWQKAEAAYRQALALAEADNQAVMIYKAQADLSGLYAFLGQKQRALDAAKAATEAARRANMWPLLTMALENQARCWLALGETVAALEAGNEILRVLDDDRASNTSRARALVLRARCYVEVREPAAARDDLNRAWSLLMPMSSIAMFAGVQSGLAGWWEVTASLRFADADLAGAVAAWRKAVEYRRHVSQLPQLEGPYKFASLANTLFHLGQTLLAEDVTEAEEAFRESREIRKRIGLSGV